MKATRRIGVYLWKCIPTGKVYVGSTAKSFRQRHNNHKLELRKTKHCNRYLQAAWNKYGESEFVWLEIEVCTSEMCIKREQYWLDFYDAANPIKGFNLSPTAGSCLGAKFGPRRKEAIDAQRAKIKEYLKDPTYREKIGGATKEGLSDPVIRKKMSEKGKKRWQDMPIEYKEKWLDKRYKKILEFWENLTVEERQYQSEARSRGRKLYFENMTIEEKAAWTEHMTRAVNKPEARAKKIASVTASWANATEEERSKRHAKLALSSKIAKEKLDSLSQEERKQFIGRRNEAIKKAWGNKSQQEKEVLAAKKSKAIKEALRLKRKRRLQEMLWED